MLWSSQERCPRGGQYCLPIGRFRNGNFTEHVSLKSSHITGPVNTPIPLEALAPWPVNAPLIQIMIQKIHGQSMLLSSKKTLAPWPVNAQKLSSTASQ